MKTKVLIVAACCIPYAFLALYGDAVYGTLAFYAILIAASAIICYSSIRTRNILLLYLGNVASFGVSLAATLLSGLNQMNWYFKPFTDVSLVIAISALTVVIHTIFVIISLKRLKQKGSKES